MNIKRTLLHIHGMTCSACEARIANALRRIDGVLRADVRLRGGTALVEYEEGSVDIEGLKTAIAEAGYAVRETKGAGTLIALGIGILLAAAYLLASASGVFNALPRIDASVGYAALFVVGLLTSIHCTAMCGGIAISQSVGVGAQAATCGTFGRLLPGALYNAGRVLSYTAIGGAVGALGSVFSFSPAARGAVAGLAGLFMVFLGLKMLGLIGGFPQLGRLLPSRVRTSFNQLSGALRSRGPFVVGILNGLMPCGPLQTMQVYALGTGSFLAGAFSMFLFSLGTVPLMLLFGATAAFLPRKFLPSMVKASAVLVMFLGMVTFTRAAALSGLALPGFSASTFGKNNASPAASGLPTSGRAEAGLPKAALADGVQSITTEFKDGYYVPFAVQAGVPLKWTIRVKAEDLNGCNNPLEVPAYGIRKKLVPGDNLIEFTPGKKGRISYSCWMGMITSSITVVGDLAADAPKLPDLTGPSSGGGCCNVAKSL